MAITRWASEMQSALLQEAVNRGEVEYFAPKKYDGGLVAALVAFGLRPQPDNLREVTHAEAVKILSALLNKGMAYGEERIPELEAQTLSCELLSPQGGDAKTIYSNGNWAAKHEGWNPMTDSTFDSGLIIQSQTEEYACLWFRDED